MNKRVLSAIAEVMPDDGHTYLANVDPSGLGGRARRPTAYHDGRTEGGCELAEKSETPSTKPCEMSDISSRSSWGASEEAAMTPEVERTGTFGQGTLVKARYSGRGFFGERFCNGFLWLWELPERAGA